MLKTSPKRGLLKLTRKPGESIRIGDDIEIVILHCTVKADGPPPVRFGIQAPREVTVLRQELTRSARIRPDNDCEEERALSPLSRYFCITRKPGQSIRIGDDIEIMILPSIVVGEWPQPVRIGIQAPREITVLRQELTQSPSIRPDADCEDEERLSSPEPPGVCSALRPSS